MDEASHGEVGSRRRLATWSLGECTDTLRRLCLGAMASVLFHEIGNILTVLNGIRQVVLEEGGAMGAPTEVAARYGELVAAQVAHSEEVASAFRSMNPEPGKDAADGLVVRDQIAGLLRLRARGRQVRVVCVGESGWRLEGESLPSLKLAFLGGCLSLLEKVFAVRAPALVTVEATGGPESGGAGRGSLACRCRLRGPGRAAAGLGHVDGSTTRMLDLARELARRHGAMLETKPGREVLAAGGPELSSGVELALTLSPSEP